VKAGHYKTAIELFQQLQQEGMIPDTFTFVQLLNACAGLQALEERRHIHVQIMERGCESNVFVGTSLLYMYAKCGSIEDAWRVFNRIPTRNVVTWNAMIFGHVKCVQGHRALELYQQMQHEGVKPVPVTFIGVLNTCDSVAALEEDRRVHEQIIEIGCESDIFVSNSLMDMYAKCGSMEDAWRVFNQMPTHDVVSWSSLILGHVKCGQGLKGLELFQQMQCEGVEPNSATFMGVLNVCASLAAFEEGIHIHSQIIKCGLDSDFLCLIALLTCMPNVGA
jgi:pentatricopeptide repeat protein